MTKRVSRRLCLVAGLGTQFALLPWAARAQTSLPGQQTWPNRPIRLSVVYPPGGISDLVARALAERLSLAFGVPVLVEHRAGAGGSAGMEALAKAKADGYTLAFSAITPLTLNPWLSRVAADPRRDPAHNFTPLASVMHTPVLLVATPAFAAKTLVAAVQAARANPGHVRWASSGFGTTGHLVLEQVQLASGARFNHIPYKGGGQQLSDALAGQFELLSTNLGPQQLQYLRNGRLTALAVGAPRRLTSLPELPTFAEAGFAGANLSSLFGIFGPPKLPAVIAARLNAEINLALQTPAMQRLLLSIDNLPAGGTAADFSREIASASAQNRRMIDAVGLQTER
jgi:tripartite-type tricarboxylate transporter receptor subunit TctC